MAVPAFDEDDVPDASSSATSSIDFAANHDDHPESDPSPVGFHECRVHRDIEVDCNGSEFAFGPMLELYASEDDRRYVQLTIRGGGLVSPGSIDDGVILEIPARSTILNLANGMRYLADKAEALGFCDGLPGSPATDHDDAFDPRPAVRESAPAAPDPAHVLAAVRAALDAPAPFASPDHPESWHVDGDDCQVCAKQRAAPFTCFTCGFDGIPLVFGCQCHQRPEATPQCGGQSDTERDLDCLHGTIECPVCGGGPGEYRNDLLDLCGRLKRIRAALSGYSVASLNATNHHSSDAATPATVVDDEDVVATGRCEPDREYQLVWSRHRIEGPFRLLSAVPPRAETPPRRARDVEVVEENRVHLENLFAEDRAGSLARLSQLNAQFLELVLAARAGQERWMTLGQAKRAYHGAVPGDDRGMAVPRIAQLQEEYDGKLIEIGAIPYPDGKLFISEDMQGFVAHRRPGVHTQPADSEQVCIDLVLGDRVSVEGERGRDREEQFGADMRIIVSDDRTMQSLALDFAERLYETYGVRTPATSDEEK